MNDKKLFDESEIDLAIAKADAVRALKFARDANDRFVALEREVEDLREFVKSLLNPPDKTQGKEARPTLPPGTAWRDRHPPIEVKFPRASDPRKEQLAGVLTRLLDYADEETHAGVAKDRLFTRLHVRDDTDPVTLVLHGESEEISVPLSEVLELALRAVL